MTDMSEPRADAYGEQALADFRRRVELNQYKKRNPERIRWLATLDAERAKREEAARVLADLQKIAGSDSHGLDCTTIISARLRKAESEVERLIAQEAAQEGGEDDPYDYIEQLQQEADEVNVLLGGHCFHHEGRMAAIKGLQARAAQGRKRPTVEEVADVIGRCVFCDTWDPLEGTASAARAVLRLFGEE